MPNSAKADPSVQFDIKEQKVPKDSKLSLDQKKWEFAVAEHQRMKKVIATAPATSSFRAYAEQRVKELEQVYPGRL